MNIERDRIYQLKKLTDKRVFTTRSEAIRFILLYSILNDSIKKEKEKKEKMEKKIVRRLENEPVEPTKKEKKSKVDVYRKNDKPKKFVNLYRKDIYKRLIVSFLNENDYLTVEELAEKMACNVDYTYTRVQRINEEYPSLIKKIVDSNHEKKKYRYKLNKEMLKGILEEIEV